MWRDLDALAGDAVAFPDEVDALAGENDAIADDGGTLTDEFGAIADVGALTDALADLTVIDWLAIEGAAAHPAAVKR